MTQKVNISNVPGITVDYSFNNNKPVITQFFWNALNNVTFYNLEPDLFIPTGLGDKHIVAVWRVKSLK